VQNLLFSGLISKDVNIKIHSTILSAVVLCGCETHSLTFGEKRRLRVFENKVLRKICVAKRDEARRE